MTQKTSKRTTPSSSATVPSLHGIFHRWLIAGLLTVAFYLTTALITALYIQTSGNASISPTGAVITTVLFTLAVITALWWLVESANGIMLYITRRSQPAKKTAAKKRTAKKK